MVWVSQGYPAPQDWSAHPGLSFWFQGSQAGSDVFLEVLENKDPDKPGSQSERWWYKIKDDFTGWKKFDVPWGDFQRRAFAGSPDDGFSGKEMWGINLIVTGYGGSRKGFCEFDQIELMPPSPEGKGAPWRALFDGKTLDGFARQADDVWRVVNGALAWNPAATQRDAMRTTKSFGDGEVRIRFDVLQEPEWFYFAIRQAADGDYKVSWPLDQARELKGRPHELVFVCRGEAVSASLDGRSVPLVPEGRPREGSLQFGSSGPGLRILAIDYR
jgi:hypothetical protein